MITVAETSAFQRKVTRLLSEHEREDLIAYLSEHPNTGVIMEGTGGIRKLRWGRSGSGKSGGVRVIYYFHNELMPLYLLVSGHTTASFHPYTARVTFSQSFSYTTQGETQWKHPYR